jgi:hypothetical protein
MNTENNNKIEDILNSLDGVQRATAPDFFYTRLKARMENNILPPTARPWILRPIYALGALAVVLLVNAAVIISRNNASDGIANNDNETIQSIAADYNLNDVSSLYDLNDDK